MQYVISLGIQATDDKEASKTAEAMADSTGAFIVEMRPANKYEASDIADFFE